MAALLETLDTPTTRIVDSMNRLLLAEAGHEPTSLRATLDRIIAAGLDRVPLPGHRHTLTRWQTLESVARHDLALVKLYESHVDALAIIAEIDDPMQVVDGDLYAVWASESRDQPITIRPSASSRSDGEVVIDGRKSWCSGAAVVDRALMTATDADGHRQLVEVALAAPGMRIERDRWQAVGMAGSGSFDVVCDGIRARGVGPTAGYLQRPGFWHGGAGIAACWHGAAAAIGTRVRDLQVGRDDVHALAHLGAIDAALASTAALLRECARYIDDHPHEDAMRLALRVRGAVADMTDVVIREARRALGPGPFCNDAVLAQRVADLPIFVAQSRAEHDRVAQGRALLANASELAHEGWTL